MAELVTSGVPATAKRRADARREGDVVLSPAVAPVAVLCLAVGVGGVAAPALVARLGVVLVEWLAAAGPAAAGAGDVGPLAWRSVRDVAGVLVPIVLATTVAGIAAAAAQVGWHPALGRVAPDPRRIALATGWRRLASPDGVARTAVAIVATVLVAAVGGHVVRCLSGAALDAAATPVGDTLALAGGGLRTLGIALAAALGAVAAVDWAWARRRHERRLRMSREELREESRQQDGDPLLRRRLRAAHRAIAERGGPAETARADVVVTGESHAVALRYRAAEGAAPRVVARGRGRAAGAIRAAARAAGVPIIERHELARALARALRPGADVPRARWRGVAEALVAARALHRPADEGTPSPARNDEEAR